MGTRLYYRPGTASMAPHAALAEIGLEYELALVETGLDGQVPESYRRVNPAGWVPTLVDGDLVLTESAAIILHLGKRGVGLRDHAAQDTPQAQGKCGDALHRAHGQTNISRLPRP